MVKKVPHFLLHVLRGFIHSILHLMYILLRYPNDSGINKRTKTVNIAIKILTFSPIKKLSHWCSSP
ncbi:transposase [Xenorhabdus bovienii]|uniref:transposase n=1 Tax=Xenorhabdus bovienii TaxID=40576 RepID=UPI0009B8B75B